MDYRNNKSDFDKNTIIYAHGRMNNTMFGTLRKILTLSTCYNDSEKLVLHAKLIRR